MHRRGRRGNRPSAVASPRPTWNSASTASTASCGCRKPTCISRLATWTAYSHCFDDAPLPGDAGRPGRGEALGIQRSRPKRAGSYADAPPSPDEYRQLGTRIVDLHPMTVMQNARTSGGGNISLVPTRRRPSGRVETWKAEKVSIWHAGLSRQSVRHAADHADDLQTDPRFGRADVSAGRSSERAVQFLPTWNRHL